MKHPQLENVMREAKPTHGQPMSIRPDILQPRDLGPSALTKTYIYRCYWQSQISRTQCMPVLSLSRVRLFPTPWTVAHQDLPSMEFSRHEYWSGLPFPSPGDLLDPEIEPRSPIFQANSLPSEPPRKPIYIQVLLTKPDT